MVDVITSENKLQQISTRLYNHIDFILTCNRKGFTDAAISYIRGLPYDLDNIEQSNLSNEVIDLISQSLLPLAENKNPEIVQAYIDSKIDHYLELLKAKNDAYSNKDASNISDVTIKEG